MNKNWWKIIKNFGTILAIVLAIMQVSDWMGRPSDSLEMELYFGDFRVPPAFTKELDRFYDFAEPEKIGAAIKLKEMLGDSPSLDEKLLAERILENFSRLILAQIQELRINPFCYLIKGYWFATVANKGSTTLTDVVAILPGSTYAFIKREGVDAVFGESTDVIQIGNMRPGEVVTLIAWSNYNISIYNAKDARVTHERGVGNKNIYVPVGRVGQIADRFWPLISWILICLLCYTAFMIIVQYIEKKSLKETTSDDK